MVWNLPVEGETERKKGFGMLPDVGWCSKALL